MVHNSDSLSIGKGPQSEEKQKGTMTLPYRKNKMGTVLSWLGLLLANLFLIGGFFLYDWNLFNLVLLYWVEGLIIGFYTVLKMLYVDTINIRSDIEVYYAVPFFLGGYSFFCVLTGLGILKIFEQYPPVSEDEILPLFIYIKHLLTLCFVERRWICVSIFLSYGVSFVCDYMKGRRYYHANLPKLMGLPVIRGISLVVMIYWIVRSAYYYSPIAALVSIICLKVLFDIFFAYLERHKIVV